MTLYLVLASVVGLGALILWAYRAGGKGEKADTLSAERKQAMEAAKIDERIAAMPDADRRSELLKRLRDR